MANPVTPIILTETLTQFLAKVVGDGTYDDVIETLKTDEPGQATDATGISTSAGQLWSNVDDDMFKISYQAFHLAQKTWQSADAAARDALGTDNGLLANDTAVLDSDHLLYYCVSVDGTAASTWAILPFAGGGDVVGPASSTDEAIARFDGATGVLLQNSTATLSDAGDLTTPGNITGSGAANILGHTDADLRFGDGLGNPGVTLNGTGDLTLNFLQGGVTTTQFVARSSGDFLFRIDVDGTQSQTAYKDDGDWEMPRNLELVGVGASLVVGANTGNSAFTLNGTGNTFLQWNQAGVNKSAIIVGGAGNIQWDIGPSAFSTFYRFTTGNWEFPANVILDSPNAVLTIGDGTGLPSINFNKSDAANNVNFAWLVAGSQRWVLKFGSGELLRFDRYNGSGVFQDSPLTFPFAGGIDLVGAVTMSTTLGVVGIATISGGIFLDSTAVINAGNALTLMADASAESVLTVGHNGQPSRIELGRSGDTAILDINKSGGSAGTIRWRTVVDANTTGDYSASQDAAEKWTLARHDGTAAREIIGITDDVAMTLLDGAQAAWVLTIGDGTNTGSVNPGRSNEQDIGTDSARWGRVYGNVFVQGFVALNTNLTLSDAYSYLEADSATQEITLPDADDIGQGTTYWLDIKTAHTSGSLLNASGDTINDVDKSATGEALAVGLYFCVSDGVTNWELHGPITRTTTS